MDLYYGKLGAIGGVDEEILELSNVAVEENNKEKEKQEDSDSEAIMDVYPVPEKDKEEVERLKKINPNYVYRPVIKEKSGDSDTETEEDEEDEEEEGDEEENIVEEDEEIAGYVDSAKKAQKGVMVGDRVVCPVLGCPKDYSASNTQQTHEKTPPRGGSKNY